MNLSRRHFFRTAAAVAAGFPVLRYLSGCEKVESEVSSKSTEPKDYFALPRGFTAKAISRVGRKMDDGLFTPGKHDGMAAFPLDTERTILVCNHEIDAEDRSAGPFGKDNRLLRNIDADLLYDQGSGKEPALGGTTTLLYNTVTQTVEREFLSLAGTMRNCAGGPTPWGTWITCEESVQVADGNFEEDHGYNFEVPAAIPGDNESGLHRALPLKAMGRFNHEAVAVHRNGIVYQTEDRGDGLIYRFIPRRPGELAAGGKLQALRVRDVPKGLDTRNWRQVRVRPGQKMAVDWVDLEDVQSPDDDLRLQGFYRKGAAKFARGEGMWYGRGQIYWCCTNGGKKQKGQIWRYTPSVHEGLPAEDRSPGVLELFVEPADGNIAENGDNLCVAPWGDIFVCEDNGRARKRLLRITQKGQIFEFARNIVNASELAGVCFSPGGNTLFVNIQFPGTTLAIKGDWKTLRDAELMDS